VTDEHNEAVELGVGGVPAVRMVGNDVAISGAQPLEVYRRWIRRALEAAMRQKFGIEMEIVMGSSATMTKRVGDEFMAGVRYFDVITVHWLIWPRFCRWAPWSRSSSLDLAEVKNPANWWGGHIGTDGGQFAYSPLAYMPDNIWYNTGRES
jgi:hypothetical protein